MRYKQSIFGTLLLGILIWANVPVSAQTSNFYDRVGVLDAQNLAQRSVVIYDVLYNLHKGIKIYRCNPEVDNRQPKDREEVSLETLTPGMTIGYTVTYKGNSQPGKIKEICILSSESIAAMDSEADEKER